MQWLLHEDYVREMQDMKRAGLVPTPEQIEAFEKRAREQEEANGAPSNLTIAGTEAEILIEGVLTEKSRFFFFREGTTYRDIRSALAIADSDPNVKRAVLKIDSPGGNVAGLFDTIAAIEQFSKPLKVVASQAQSAAFALASAGGKIEAAGKASEFGSIGVAITFRIFEDEVTLTNSDSPEKRPDPTTPEGQASIVAHLDAINDLFVDAIATGRTRSGKATSSTQVKTMFGRGATMLAKEAKRLGMIDRITGQKPILRTVIDADEHDDEDFSAETPASNPAEGGQQENTMDLKTLKQDHRALYDSIMEAGSKHGVEEERDRVSAHLILGAQAGEEGMKIALKAIDDSSKMTQKLTADYLSAGIKRADKVARQAETDAAGKTIDGEGSMPAADGPDLGDEIVARWDKKHNRTSTAAA